MDIVAFLLSIGFILIQWKMDVQKLFSFYRLFIYHYKEILDDALFMSVCFLIEKIKIGYGGGLFYF